MKFSFPVFRSEVLLEVIKIGIVVSDYKVFLASALVGELKTHNIPSLVSEIGFDIFVDFGIIPPVVLLDVVVVSCSVFVRKLLIGIYF